MKSLIKLAALAALSCGILASSYAGNFTAALSAPGNLSGVANIPAMATVMEACGTAAPGAVLVNGPLGLYDEGPQRGQGFQQQSHTGSVGAGMYGYNVTEYSNGFSVISFSW
jgi:hypothetical protein